MRGTHSTTLGLAAFTAVFAYLPFELVAKFTLVLCAGIFILDPFPLSRVIAVVAVGVVGILAKTTREWKENNQEISSSVAVDGEGSKDIRKED